MEMRRDELKARARELERAGKSREACEIYIGIAQHDEGAAAATLWTRVGFLQLSGEDAAAAANSFSTAIELFAAAGQRNNALAVSRTLLDISPERASSRSTAARLAIEEGYHDLARAAAMRLLEVEPVEDDLRASIVIAAAFGIRFPDDAAFWRGWVDSALTRSGRERTLAALTQLEAQIGAAGSVAVAQTIRDEIARIDPGEAEAGPAQTTREPLEGLEATEPADLQLDEPFISPGPLHSTRSAQEARPGRDVAPLEGLESTNASVDAGDEGETVHLDGRLPLLDPSVQQDADTSAEGAEEAEADLEEQPPNDLPLLGARPPTELPTFSEPEPDLVDSEGADDSADEPLPLLENSPTADHPFEVAAILGEIASVTTREADPSDAATHYDLGLAFKEMDLLEESIAQFASAIAGGFRTVASLEVIGEILVGRGDHEAAARILQLVTETDSVPDLERVGVLYWLARCREVMGDADEAHRLWRRVAAVDPNFRDTSERLRSSARSRL
jgi:tetratricopeptide (TPR) repeat protein